MAHPRQSGEENYFAHDADIGIIGRGESIEICFANAARAMFALMADLSHIHTTQIITFEFEEADLEFALVTWLNLLLSKAHEHHLMLSDFRLKREGDLWKATVAGERWRESIERGVEVKGATLTMLSINKVDHRWEARCVVDV
jgi:SHS2 domain-containing protein